MNERMKEGKEESEVERGVYWGRDERKEREREKNQRPPLLRPPPRAF